jgi:hypothetical protein
MRTNCRVRWETCQRVPEDSRFNKNSELTLNTFDRLLLRCLIRGFDAPDGRADGNLVRLIQPGDIGPAEPSGMGDPAGKQFNAGSALHCLRLAWLPPEGEFTIRSFIFHAFSAVRNQGFSMPAGLGTVGDIWSQDYKHAIFVMYGIT